MFQLTVIRFITNFALGLLSHVQTIVWLVLVGTVIGYGYLVFTNGLDFFAGFDQIKTYAINGWSLLQDGYAQATDYFAGSKQ